MDYNYLYHYGIPGMRWGVRRSKKSLARARKKANIHDDYKNAHNKKSIKSMSNAELDSRISRLNKEKQYKNLRLSEKGRLMDVGHKQLQKYALLGTTLVGVAATTTTIAVKYGKPVVNKILEHRKVAWVL